MKFYYFVDKEGVRQGPLPLDDLSTYDISPTTLVWTKGMEKWLKAKDVDDFRDILQSSQVTNDILPATENPEETPKNIPNTSPVSSENEYVDEVSTEETEEKSSNLKYWIIGAVLVVIVSIVFFGYNKTESVTDTVDTLAIDSVSESDYVDEENIVKEFIVNMYNNALYDEYRFLENHCTKHLLDVLRADYEYDGTGYAVWDFRTCAQDVNPDCNEGNRVINVETNGDGWYTYEFYDGGWRGKNRVKAFIRDGEVIMDALERVYDECAEAGLHSHEEAKAKVKALLETNGKHTLEGYLTNNNSDYNTEKVKIVFTQSDGNVYNCTYYNEGVWDEHRNERIEMHGIRTAEGYHLENNNDYDSLVIDVTLNETSLRGYAIRDGHKYSINLNLE